MCIQHCAGSGIASVKLVKHVPTVVQLYRTDISPADCELGDIRVFLVIWLLMSCYKYRREFSLEFDGNLL